MAAIEPTIIVIIVWYAIVVGGGIMLVLYRTNRRITLRQYPTPHSPIGEDSYTGMRNQIKLHLARVSQIKVQPRFLTVEGSRVEEAPDALAPTSDSLIHRMQAVDSMRSLERMVKEILPSWEKSKSQSEREFLYVLSRPGAPLAHCPDVCAALLDSYERARYGDQPYGENDKQVFLDTHMDIINRLSIISPEDFVQGPLGILDAIDESGVTEWLQAPFNTPEFPRHSMHRNSSNTNVARPPRDLIDLSLSESENQGDIERPTSMEIVNEDRGNL